MAQGKKKKKKRTKIQMLKSGAAGIQNGVVRYLKKKQSGGAQPVQEVAAP